MGKVTWTGWVTDPEEIRKANAVTPLGPFIKRDGKQVIVLTVPAAKAAQPEKPKPRKPAAKR
jgi:hypothetical protein